MSDQLFDSSILASTQDSLDFIISVLQPSTESSIIGKGMDGTIHLCSEVARRRRGYERELVDSAGSSIRQVSEAVRSKARPLPC